jgi:hypothetical protein
VKYFFVHSKTPQVERNWGGGEKREKEKVENREILSSLERKCPVENVLTFYMWRESLYKRENLCETLHELQKKRGNSHTDFCGRS